MEIKHFKNKDHCSDIGETGSQNWCASCNGVTSVSSNIFGLRSFGLLQFPTELPRVILPYLVGPRGLDTN